MRSAFMSADEHRTWASVMSLLALLPNQIDQQLLRDEQLGHFEYLTLASLAQLESRRERSGDLAARTNATRPRMSHTLRRLESRGYVRRLPAADDARSIVVELTESGMQKIVAATPAHVANVRHLVLDALSPEQQHELRDLLLLVLKRLDPDGRVTMIREEEHGEDPTDGA